jgi:hypothetical protein
MASHHRWTNCVSETPGLGTEDSVFQHATWGLHTHRSPSMSCLLFLGQCLNSHCLFLASFRVCLIATLAIGRARGM